MLVVYSIGTCILRSAPDSSTQTVHAPTETHPQSGQPCPVCPVNTSDPITSCKRLVESPIKWTNGRTHVVYVRIPKTGSSTISMTMWQYAWRRNLTVMVTNVHPDFTGTQKSLAYPGFHLPAKGTKCDMMAEHVIYNRASFARYFHADTVYITMLREPMAMLHSSLHYIPEYAEALPGDDKLVQYLNDPERYDDIAIKADRSFTRNPQIGYLGLRRKDFNNLKEIHGVISAIAAEFPLVMVLERLDESLVLLKRLLGWELVDVIPSESSRNANKNKPYVPISDQLRTKYKKWSLADHLLYNFFYEKLDEYIEQSGSDFQNEVGVFRKLRKDFEHFCRFDAFKGEILKIPKTAYSEPTVITGQDCLLHNSEPLVLIGMIRKRQGVYPYLHHSLQRL